MPTFYLIFLFVFAAQRSSNRLDAEQHLQCKEFLMRNSFASLRGNLLPFLDFLLILSKTLTERQMILIQIFDRGIWTKLNIRSKQQKIKHVNEKFVLNTF